MRRSIIHGSAEEEQMNRTKRNSRNDPQIKTMRDILPIRSYDEQIGSFILEDKSLLDLLQVMPADRDNLQGDELKYNIILSTRFYRLYAPDGKLISMNFPINTSLQRRHLQRRLKRTPDIVRKEWIEREIDELLTLDQNVMRREYYLMYFGKDADDFLKNKSRILKSMGYGRNKLVEEISKEKKIQIIRKICNMNTLILPDELEEDANERKT